LRGDYKASGINIYERELMKNREKERSSNFYKGKKFMVFGDYPGNVMWRN
jgi:hypothetical protein